VYSINYWYACYSLSGVYWDSLRKYKEKLCINNFYGSSHTKCSPFDAVIFKKLWATDLVKIYKPTATLSPIFSSYCTCLRRCSYIMKWDLPRNNETPLFWKCREVKSHHGIHLSKPHIQRLQKFFWSFLNFQRNGLLVGWHVDRTRVGVCGSSNSSFCFVFVVKTNRAGWLWQWITRQTNNVLTLDHRRIQGDPGSHVPPNF